MLNQGLDLPAIVSVITMAIFFAFVLFCFVRSQMYLKDLPAGKQRAKKAKITYLGVFPLVQTAIFLISTVLLVYVVEGLVLVYAMYAVMGTVGALNALIYVLRNKNSAISGAHFTGRGVYLLS